MQVLVVNANRAIQPVPVIPFGACIVADAAERAGHAVRFLDLLFERNPERALEKELRSNPPGAVGISVRNIDNNDIVNTLRYYEDVPPLVRTVRRVSRAPVLLGGAAVAVMPEALLRLTGADFAAVGDGDVTFPRILDALSRGDDPGSVEGVARLEGGEFRQNGVSRSFPMSDCPAPDFPRWVNVGKYRRRMSTAPIQSKRGCPFECVYCTYSVAEGRSYRLCPPEKVVAQIRRLVEMGLPDIEFVDNVFNSPHEHAMAVCRALAEAKLPARLQTLELNPRFVDDELLDAMKAAGFVGVAITLESASDPVLIRLHKGFNADDARRCAEAIARHDLQCLWIFMFGGPGETRETVRETLRFAQEYIRPSDIAFFTLRVRIYPGTGLDRIARDEGQLAVPPNDMLDPVFYLSPGVDHDWLESELKAATAGHLNMVTGDAISISLAQKVLHLAYLVGFRPPLWKHARKLRILGRLLGAYR